jgi:hypothetical protein
MRVTMLLFDSIMVSTDTQRMEKRIQYLVQLQFSSLARSWSRDECFPFPGHRVCWCSMYLFDSQSSLYQNVKPSPRSFFPYFFLFKTYASTLPALLMHKDTLSWPKG